MFNICLPCHAFACTTDPQLFLAFWRAQRFVQAMDTILAKILTAHSTSARRTLRSWHVFGGDKLVKDFTQQVGTFAAALQKVVGLDIAY